MSGELPPTSPIHHHLTHTCLGPPRSIFQLVSAHFLPLPHSHSSSSPPGCLGKASLTTSLSPPSQRSPLASFYLSIRYCHHLSDDCLLWRITRSQGKVWATLFLILNLRRLTTWYLDWPITYWPAEEMNLKLQQGASNSRSQIKCQCGCVLPTWARALSPVVTAPRPL